ncbi:unnamed protein product [Closterium sp. NIES-53]
MRLAITRVGGAGAREAAAGDPVEPGGSGAGGAGVGGAGFGDTGAVGGGAGGTSAGGAGAGGAVFGGIGARGTVRLRPYFVPLLQQVLASTLLAPSPYTVQTRGLTERREPESRPASPDRVVRTGRRDPCPRPPPVPSTHAMALRPASLPLRVPLTPPPASSLPAVPHPESNLARAASPTASRLLATVLTHPSFESAAASALVAELVDFAAACRLDYATALVAKSESASPPSVGGECALGTDVLEERQEDFEHLAAAVPRFASTLLAPEGDPDAPDIPTLRSYAEAITSPYSSRLKRPPGSPPAFKARYVARGFSQRQGVDYFHTFSPTSKMTTLWVLLHVAAQRDYDLGQPIYGLRQAPCEWHDTLRTTLAALGFSPSTDPSLFLRTDTSLPPFYVLVYVDDLVFATANTEALTRLKLELQKRHTCTDLGPSALSLPVLLTIAHSSVYQPLALSSTFGRVRRAEWFVPRACGLPHLPDDVHTTWPCVLSQPPCLQRGSRTSGMGLVLGGRGPVVLTGHADASWVDDSATQRSSQCYTFSLGSGSVSWRSTRSSSVLSFSCEAEIYARAMAALELSWLTYLLTDLGEQPHSPLVLYVDNKAIALCQEHRTKHIALRYFLA